MNSMKDTKQGWSCIKITKFFHVRRNSYTKGRQRPPLLLSSSHSSWDFALTTATYCLIHEGSLPISPAQVKASLWGYFSCYSTTVTKIITTYFVAKCPKKNNTSPPQPSSSRATMAHSQRIWRLNKQLCAILSSKVDHALDFLDRSGHGWQFHQ